MTKEELKRANEITKEISIIQQNLLEVHKISQRNNEFDECANLILSDGHYKTELSDDFLVVSLKDFIAIYKTKAESHINKLNKELENL